MSHKFNSNNSHTDWQRLDAITDEDIDLSDCPEATQEMFNRAIVRKSSSCTNRATLTNSPINDEDKRKGKD